MQNPKPKFTSHWTLQTSMALVLTFVAVIAVSKIAQADNPDQETKELSTFHPNFAFLDENGDNVLDSGGAVSTMQTCGVCHDTLFIANHSFHASIGADELVAPGQTDSTRAWDIGSGFFGKWNPIGYRYLSPKGDERIDLTTPEWIRTYGIRHAGGGPAVYSQSGQLLSDLPVSIRNPETSIFDPAVGKMVTWNWDDSGIIEMNCFLCHIPEPNAEARANEIHAGNFRWANTATLVGTGLVSKAGNTYQWNPEAFDSSHELKDESIIIQDPTNNNCALCHGLVHDDVKEPITTTGCSPERWSTVTTGQIISPQRLSDSGMNLADKDDLSRTWDVHTERLLKCTDCHYSINNPLYYQERGGSQPEHLLFDPRRLDIGEYLEKPLHQFARGNSAQGTIAPELKDTMRRCDSCHNLDTTHNWLPYKDRHMQIVSCESCHIPKLYSSANMQHDWTVLTLQHTAATTCRGADGNVAEIQTLLTGYEPSLLPRKDVDGNLSLAPHNLITTWFWIYGDPARPVPLRDLEAAFFENDAYHPGIMLRFDANQDGHIDETELVIDSLEKEQFIKERLEFLGLGNPRITGEVQPYSINHDIAEGEWVLRECQSCHSENSRITQPIQLSKYVPGGNLPTFIPDTNVVDSGTMQIAEDGSLYFHPNTQTGTMYVFGLNQVNWVDSLGSILFFGVLLGVSGHASLRFYSTRLRKPQKAASFEVYMYTFYERLWHWLQTFSIMMLLFTGLIIHKPDTFGMFSFNGVVITHNVLAVILALNAVFALFYHLASGEIKQYLPEPRGFFGQSIEQAKYYLDGIFKGADHPFQKSTLQKLNPLQQITYLAILNILLPLQGLTGILMWGVQRWPNIAGAVGGLSFLAPFHSLIAWTFASFIVLHVYLTTTGHTPMAGIQAMMLGWESVESPETGSKEESRS